MTENEVLVKTPEEAIETIKKNMPTSGYQMLRESLDMAITAIKEAQEYRAIGTVEECRGAMEKQNKKRPIKILKGPLGYDFDLVCPNCRHDLDSPHIESYCPYCGQGIKWINE